VNVYGLLLPFWMYVDVNVYVDVDVYRLLVQNISPWFTRLDNVHKMSIDEQFCGILRVGRVMINSYHVRLQLPEAASHWKIFKVPPGPVSWNTGNAFLSGSGILHQLLTRIAHQDFATITGFPHGNTGLSGAIFSFFGPSNPVKPSLSPRNCPMVQPASGWNPSGAGLKVKLPSLSPPPTGVIALAGWGRLPGIEKRMGPHS